MTEPGSPQPFDPPSSGQPYQPPAAGSAAYGQPYGAQPHGTGPAGPRRNGLGIAALVLGVLALVTSFTVLLGLVLGLAAIVLGVLGRGRARRGEADNGGVALAGLVLGVLGLVASIAIAVAVGSVFSRVINSPEGQRLQECLEQAGGDQTRVQACRAEFERSAGR